MVRTNSWKQGIPRIVSISVRAFSTFVFRGLFCSCCLDVDRKQEGVKYYYCIIHKEMFPHPCPKCAIPDVSFRSIISDEDAKLMICTTPVLAYPRPLPIFYAGLRDFHRSENKLERERDQKEAEQAVYYLQQLRLNSPPAKDMPKLQEKLQQKRRSVSAMTVRGKV